MRASVLLTLCFLWPGPEAVASGTTLLPFCSSEFGDRQFSVNPAQALLDGALRRPEPRKASRHRNGAHTSVGFSGFCSFGLGEGVFVFMMLVFSRKKFLFCLAAVPSHISPVFSRLSFPGETYRQGRPRAQPALQGSGYGGARRWERRHGWVRTRLNKRVELNKAWDSAAGKSTWGGGHPIQG